MTLRRFAFANIWFWLAQHPVTVAWYASSPELRARTNPFEFYLVQISIAALWLSALAWHSSCRVEEEALTVDDLVENTDIEPT